MLLGIVSIIHNYVLIISIYWRSVFRLTKFQVVIVIILPLRYWRLSGYSVALLCRLSQN